MSFVERSMKNKRTIGIVMFAGCFLLGIIFSWNVDRKFQIQNTLTSEQQDAFVYEFASEGLFTRAIATAKNVKREQVLSGIVAHHLLVADQIAQEFARLGSGREKVIVILSPNHFSAGRSVMQTTNGSWNTPYGYVDSDSQAVIDLRELVPDMGIEPTTFKGEHGVSAIAPFVKEFFPQARVVAVAIDEKASIEQTQSLAQAIARVLPSAIVVASVDMSHNLPESVQIYHDEITMRSIQNGGCEGGCQLEVDANTVLDTLFEINRLRGNQHWVQTYHGSSLAMGATTAWRDNTSHILGSFESGEPEYTSFVSLQFVGDVMLDRGVRTKMNQFGFGYPWKEVKRFFMGSDVRVANLEGTVSKRGSLFTEDPPFLFSFEPSAVQEMRSFVDVVSLANNHANDFDVQGEGETHQWLETLGVPWFGGFASSKDVFRIDKRGMALSVVGFNQFGSSIDELLQVIANEKKHQRIVVVVPHWGEEYVQSPNEQQRELARRMITAGASLIIGSHPHVAQSMEMIDGVPVIYSLGNFIFDQGFDNTDMALSVGVIFKNKHATLFVSGIGTSTVQPVPLLDQQSQDIQSLLTFPLEPIVFTYDESSFP